MKSAGPTRAGSRGTQLVVPQIEVRMKGRGVYVHPNMFRSGGSLDGIFGGLWTASMSAARVVEMALDVPDQGWRCVPGIANIERLFVGD